MQTNLARRFIRDTPDGREADAILRACVHCGFCTATCPTYQLLGDELDGPRGRIYLIKQVLEGDAGHGEDAAAPRPLPDVPQLRDDVPVRRAATAGWSTSAGASSKRKVGRTPARGAQRWRCGAALLVAAAVRRARSRRAASLKRLAAARAARDHIPRRRAAGAWPRAAARAPDAGARKAACSRALAPNIDAATARVLDRIGISPMRAAAGGGCCGALSHHLSADDEARAIVRRNIDAWWPHVERGVEAIVVTASGCGVMVKDYGHLLARRSGATPRRRKRVAELARDPVEVVARRVEADRAADRDGPRAAARRVPFAVHAAARHAASRGRVEEILHGARPRAAARRRSAPVLRLGRHVLDAAAGAVGQAEGQQARGARGRRART